MSPSKPVRPQIGNELTDRTRFTPTSFRYNGPHLIDSRAVKKIARLALAEDLPDITTDAIFDARERGHARFVVKGNGILAGLPFARAVFKELDSRSRFQAHRNDGVPVSPGDVVAEVDATVRALLSGERTALNLLQRASGIATTTRRFVDAVEGTAAEIYDTRKTAPGLRALDKYAVVAGGGQNHRQGLFDMFLIKNNHIDGAGSLRVAVEKVRKSRKKAPIMVEARSLEEMEEALLAGPDFILLDNMTPDQLRQAVQINKRRLPLEASGGVTLDTIRAIAETGVDRISIGALTHSVRALDISMRIESP